MLCWFMLHVNFIKLTCNNNHDNVLYMKLSFSFVEMILNFNIFWIRTWCNHFIHHILFPVSGFISHEENALRNILKALWFSTYPKSLKYNTTDSSGFEHIFCGEIKKSRVTGKSFYDVTFFLFLVSSKDGSLALYDTLIENLVYI